VIYQRIAKQEEDLRSKLFFCHDHSGMRITQRQTGVQPWAVRKPANRLGPSEPDQHRFSGLKGCEQEAGRVRSKWRQVLCAEAKLHMTARFPGVRSRRIRRPSDIGAG